jgi:hypothetical protein
MSNKWEPARETGCMEKVFCIVILIIYFLILIL